MHQATGGRWHNHCGAGAPRLSVTLATGGQAMAGFCQHCGASHDDDAQFCPKCGRPLAMPSTATQSAPQSFTEKYAGTPYSATPFSTTQPQTAPAQPSSGLSRRQIRIGAIVAVIIIAAVAAWQLGFFARLTSQGGTAGNIPPSGQIWFGSSFDTNTFALRGITTSFRNRVDRRTRGPTAAQRLDWQRQHARLAEWQRDPEPSDDDNRQRRAAGHDDRAVRHFRHLWVRPG